MTSSATFLRRENGTKILEKRYSISMVSRKLIDKVQAFNNDRK